MSSCHQLCYPSPLAESPSLSANRGVAEVSAPSLRWCDSAYERMYLGLFYFLLFWFWWVNCKSQPPNCHTLAIGSPLNYWTTGSLPVSRLEIREFCLLICNGVWIFFVISDHFHIQSIDCCAYLHIPQFNPIICLLCLADRHSKVSTDI